MAIKLASLFVEIGARGDKLLAELTKSERDAKTWSGRIKRTTGVAAVGFGAVTVAATGAGAALAAIYQANADQIASQEKLATRLGTTSSELKILAVGARSAGVDVDGVNDTLADFVERLGEAKVDGGEPAEALDLLGLSAQQLIEQDPARALRDVLAAMSSIPDAGVRAATAAKLFGDAGIELTTNAGGLTRALDLAETKIDSLGGSLTALESSNVVAAQSAVGDLGLIAELAGERITAKLAPAVYEVATAIFDAATRTEGFEETVDRMVAGGIQGLASLSRAAGTVLGYIASTPEVAEYGIAGYLLYGKKGLLVGAALGELGRTVDVYGKKLKGVLGIEETRIESLVRQRAILEDDIRRAERRAASGIGDALDRGAVGRLAELRGALEGEEPIRAKVSFTPIEELRGELSELDAEIATIEGGAAAVAAETGTIGTAADAAAESMTRLTEALSDVAEGYAEGSGAGESLNEGVGAALDVQAARLASLVEQRGVLARSLVEIELRAASGLGSALGDTGTDRIAQVRGQLSGLDIEIAALEARLADGSGAGEPLDASAGVAAAVDERREEEVRKVEAARRREVAAARAAKLEEERLEREAAMALRKIREEQLSENKLRHAQMFDMYADYQTARVAAANDAAAAEDPSLGLANLESYFASRASKAEESEQIWSAFQAGGAKDRLEILANETSSALSTLGQHDRKMFKIMKTANIAKAIVSTATGVARALELPFPANLAAAATVAVQGIAQVNTIKATEFGKEAVPSTPSATSSGIGTEGVAGAPGSLGADQVVPNIPTGGQSSNLPGARAPDQVAQVPQQIINIYVEPNMGDEEFQHRSREAIAELQDRGEVTFERPPQIIRQDYQPPRRRAG